MTPHIDLDHIAVASSRQSTAWPRYAGDLGGEWVAGGFSIGFRSAQVRYRRGMKVEVIAPHRADRNDFLERFLEQRGPGPHHLTFKVPDIRAALAAADDAGYPPVNVDLRDPRWMEGFLHPKVAHGVVIQLAQAADEWTAPPPRTLPASVPPQPADFLHVAHAVKELAEARRLFEDVLHGSIDGEAEGAVDLSWPGSGCVRLVDAKAAELLDWVGEAGGRVHHLAFATENPAAVADATPLGDGTFEVGPADNLGTRLRLSAG